MPQVSAKRPVSDELVKEANDSCKGKTTDGILSEIRKGPGAAAGYGSAGRQVALLQILHNRMVEERRIAGGNIAVDGKFGPETLEAAKKIQAYAGVVQDGRVGSVTLDALETKFEIWKSKLVPVVKPAQMQAQPIKIPRPEMVKTGREQESVQFKVNAYSSTEMPGREHPLMDARVELGPAHKQARFRAIPGGHFSDVNILLGEKCPKQVVFFLGVNDYEAPAKETEREHAGRLSRLQNQVRSAISSAKERGAETVVFITTPDYSGNGGRIQKTIDEMNEWLKSSSDRLGARVWDLNAEMRNNAKLEPAGRTDSELVLDPRFLHMADGPGKSNAPILRYVDRMLYGMKREEGGTLLVGHSWLSGVVGESFRKQRT